MDHPLSTGRVLEARPATHTRPVLLRVAEARVALFLKKKCDGPTSGEVSAVHFPYKIDFSKSREPRLRWHFCVVRVPRTSLRWLFCVVRVHADWHFVSYASRANSVSPASHPLRWLFHVVRVPRDALLEPFVGHFVSLASR